MRRYGGVGAVRRYGRRSHPGRARARGRLRGGQCLRRNRPTGLALNRGDLTGDAVRGDGLSLGGCGLTGDALRRNRLTGDTGKCLAGDSLTRNPLR